MKRPRLVLWLLAAVLAVGLGASILVACSQTPTSVPIRTFERAQRVDVICLRLYGPDAPAPQPQEACGPVPPNVNGLNLESQLFALVTQTSRGEVAVVNLSAGRVIDQSHPVPGLNFLPVGAVPTDVAATPDGRMAFVASAEPNKFAIYGIPGHRILGDDAQRLYPIEDTEGPVTLRSWPVCSLPQRPGALSIVPRRTSPVSSAPGADAGSDAGEADAAADAGGAPEPLAYELVAVLPGDRTTPAKVVTIDPRPFLRGAPRRLADGTVSNPYGDGPTLTPGVLADCPITSAVELATSDVVPDTFRPGAVWPDGVPYADGGADLTCALPPRPGSCGPVPCKCLFPDGGAPDAGDAGDAGDVDLGDGGTCDPSAGQIDTAELPLELGPLEAPQPVAVARDDQLLYIADDALPIVHVVDLSSPGAPQELPPFVLSSYVDPSRAVSVRDIALSPPTRDFKRFLYAVDRKEGSIAVFDVTDPRTADRSPLRRPHPELNPFQPPDRIAFAAPVVAVAFARHDVPLAQRGGVAQPSAATGVLCNPNNAANAGAELGFYYRVASTDVQPGLVPNRLRGVFAFATLSNGQVVTIDVDDWDAPCRRPLELTEATATGSLAVPQLEGSDPWQAPIAAPDSVTQEVFFPVSAPHRLRSSFLLRDDSVTGKHVPFVPSTPSIQSTGAPLPLFGQGSEGTPRLRPTAPRPGVAAGTENIGVRFSLDTPDVHFDQDWSIVYEGTLPGFDGLPATIATTDAYSSLVLSQPQARFCAKGVEDWAVSGERANAITTALQSAGRPVHPERLDRRLVDYVQVTDDLLGPGDAYWRQADLPAPNSCWDPRLTPTNPADGAEVERIARARYDVCANVFGSAIEENSNRDFPILEAYDDHLVVGRFATIPPNESREVIYSDPSNAPYLKLMRCCFHNQIRYSIRAASQWVTVGSTVGFLSHITRGEGGRCVSSCDPREALLNARAPSVPFGPGDFAPFRDSPLAVRNPSFSFFIQNGQLQGEDVVPTRETSWRFQTRGQFTPLVVNLAAQTTAVNPQSMRFIETLGQMAVVDGASQGLVLIDLNSVTIARAPYF